jgi:glycosyltransferase involved in cell wall biosynthesis
VRQPEALASALADLITNPEGAAKMADRARTLAESNFSLEGMVEAQEALYRQVLNG